MPESARRFRFGLSWLLILPLWLSPLFLSSLFVRQQFDRSEPSTALFFNMLACAVAYAAFFTARSRRRIYREGQPGPRHVLPSVRIGALFGMLFMAQIILPLWAALLIAEALLIGEALRAGGSVVGYLLGVLFSRGFLQAVAMGGLLGLFGVFLGAFGGSLVGLVFDRRYARRLP